MKKLMAKMVERARRVKMPTLLRFSAAFTIIGLVLMVWSLLQPTPLPVMLAMSVGQMFGTAAFVLDLISIVIDLRRVRRARRDSQRELEGL